MSKEIEKINDYTENIQLLIEQFKLKEKFVKVLESDALQADDLEDAIFEIRDFFWIDTAEGVQLDIIGDIQGEPREGRTDTEYRQSIKVKIIVNNGSGEHEVVISAMTGLYGASSVRLEYSGLATLRMWTDITVTSEIYQELLEIIAAGVGLEVVFGSDKPFAFLGHPTGKGFGKLKEDVLEWNDSTPIEWNDSTPIDIVLNEADSGNPDAGEYQAIIQ